MAKTREQLEAELKGWQTVYNSAKKRGNKKAMENAHEAANKIREEMGTAKTSEQSQAELNGWGYVYNAAKRRGDTEGMAEAHRQANKIRAEQGWEYDEGSGKTYDRIFGPIKRTVNSKTVMQNAKIWNPKDVELYYKPEHYTTFTTTPTRRTLTTPASSYLRGSLNTPSLPSAAARQNDPVYSAALDLTTGKYESTDAQDFAKSLAYGTEKTLAGAAGAVEDALRFASGYGNKLLSGITSLGGLADNPLSDSLAQTAENTLSGSYVDRWRQSIDERYQPTEFQQKLGELNEAAGAMLPSIAASIATGGLSNAAAIGKGASMTAAGARAAQDISRGIGLATMFPQVAGSSTRQAIQEGANVDSALAYGALSGGLETATESLFAGIPGISGGRVSQAVQNIIAKATKSPAVSKVADILGEGVEEVISGYVTPYLQRLTYNEQAELASNDELLENFISGVALSGIMQGGSGIAGRIANRSAGQGIDVNSLGENSRKNYIAQMERDGGTTRGFEEQWKRYNDAGRAGIPFDQVNADTTGIGMSRAYAAHAAGMNDYRANAVNSAQSIIDGETAQSETIDRALDVEESRKMLEKAIGKTLPESYAKARETVWNWQAERLRKDTAPSESVSSEQSAETEVMAHTVAESSSQKAATPSQSEQTTTYTPGLVQNNYTASVSESTAKSIDSIAKKVGVSVEISDNVSASGEYRDGVIRINANSDNPVQQIFVHELTHHLEQSKGYSDLVSVIEKNLRTDGIDTQSLKDQIKSEYSERGVELDDDGANRELVAKYAESYLFTDESSIQRLANQNRSLAQRIKDWIHGLTVKLKGTKQEKALLEAEKKYQRALAGIGKPASSQGTQLSSGSSFDKLLRDAGYTQQADALQKAARKYGTIQPPARSVRDVPIPKQVSEGSKVSKFSRTVAESQIASDELVAELTRGVAAGEYNYEPVTNRGDIEQALQEIEQDSESAERRFNMAMGDEKRITSKDVALGIELIAKAERDGDAYKANRIAADLAVALSEAGQAIQAASIMTRLDKTGQLMALHSTANKIQRGIDKLNEAQPKKAARTKRKNVKAAGQSAKKDATDSVKQGRSRANKELDDFGTGRAKKPTTKQSRSQKRKSSSDRTLKQLKDIKGNESWEKTGSELAKRISLRFSKKSKSVQNEILSNLIRFSEEYLGKEGKKSTKRTAVDRLAHYFKNKDEYTKAWNYARDTLIERYKNEPDKLDAIEEFLTGTIDYSGSPIQDQRMILSAILSEVNSKGELYNEASLIGSAREANRIFESLKSKIGVSGSDAEILRLAIRRNLSEYLIDKTGTDRVRKMIQHAAAESDIELKNLPVMSDAEKAVAYDKIRNNLVQKYATTEEEAAAAETVLNTELETLANDYYNDWVSNAGNELAKRISSMFNPPSVSKTTSKTIVSDLVKFSREHIDMRSNGQTKGMSAIDTLRNYFANKDEYTIAWNAARDQLREQYKNDSEKLDALESFLQATIDYNGDPLHNQAVILSAILSTVDSNGELIDRASVIGSASISEQIANKLIAETGVSGTNAVILREAVSRNLSDYLIEKTSPTKLKSLIQKAAKENGTKLKELATATPKRRAEIYQQIRNTLVSRHAATAEEAAAAEQILTSEYQNLVRKYSESAIKARFKERMVSPRKDFWDVYREYAAMGVFDSEYAAKASEKLFGSDKIKVDDALAQRLLNAETPEEIEAATEAIKDDIAAQIPPTWEDKIQAWPYVAMLTNFRTLFLRMPLGNVAFQPLKVTKDVIAGTLEPIFLKKGNRTKSLTGALWGTGGKYREFASADYKKMEKILKSGGKMNPTDDISARKRIFKLLPLEATRKFSQFIMDRGDTPFLSSAYVRAMVQYAKANKLTVEQLQGEQLDKAREIAMSEALKATFRDYSKAATALNNLEKNLPPIVKIAMKGIIPFVKTPINMGKRGIEYSPLGLLRTVGKVHDMLAKGNATGADVIDSLSASLSGSAFLVLGVLLARAGMLKAGGDDDKGSQFLDSLGFQSYAFKVGDTSYTIDWLAPAAIPLFLGAEIQPYLDEGTFGIAEAQEAGFRILDVMTEMSFMSGINDALQAVKYGGEGNDLSKIFNQALASYILQYIPSALSQLAQVSDPYRRTKYTDPNSELPGLVQEIQQGAMKKIPGLSQKLPPYVDMWGRTQKEDNTFKRIFNQISPGFIKEETLNNIEQELIRLSGNGYTAFPGKFESSFDYDGGTYEMDAEEYTKYKVKVGATQYAIINNLLSNSGYAFLDDSEKKDVISKVYSFAKILGRKEIIPDYPVQSSDQKMIDAYNLGIKYDDYLIIKQDVSGIESFKDEDGKTVTNSSGVRKAYYLLTETSLTPSQRSYMYDVLNVGKKVREMSPEKVKSEYQEMYNKYGR